MPAVKRSRNNLTEDQRLEIGKLIDEEKLTTSDAANKFKIGFSTAGACATAYRRGLDGKTIAKKTKPQKKPEAKVIKGIRYDNEFKSKAVNMVLNGGPPNARRTHKEVGDELGVSSSGVRKWVFEYDESGSAELGVKVENYKHEMAISAPPEIKTLQKRIDELEAENALLKPMVRKYLNL